MMIRKTPISRPFIAAVVLVVLVAAGLRFSQGKADVSPDRDELVLFPMKVEEWRGRQSALSDAELESLKVSDYLLANYTQGWRDTFVNVYVAYYADQRAGQAIHSPQACIPGGGWGIEEFSKKTIELASAGGRSLQVNRAVIRKGRIEQLVYYWFEQRGRNLTNEYAVKWYILRDGLLENRTDGALVRVITPIRETDSGDDADRRLGAFVEAIYPKLGKFVPS